MPSQRFHPVLIIPGFMSSGLQVEKSDTASWVGKRVWINLNSLGFQSIYRGSAIEANESLKKEGETFSKKQHEEYQEQAKCKSKWLHHISLSEDMITERPGIQVRPISGLHGVDYLSPGALTSHLSYVFGPVIVALKGAGYTDDNLDAAPYDWRLPPSELETRDGYFTGTMRQVEEMYRRNDNTPVVLLCHSLGCKTGHYFLNFVLDHSEGGQAWMDKHIHAYMPVGAPHLGAAKAVRALVDGDKMGLDAFLNDEEGLILGRSLGSGPWLAPRHVPAKSPPTVYIRREGLLEITLPTAIDCTDLVRERKDSPPMLRLAVMFGKECITTDFVSPTRSRGGKLVYQFGGKFCFPTPAEIPASSSIEGTIQIALQEKGIKGKKRDDEGILESPLLCPLRCALRILMCPIKYVLCLPCTLVGCVLCTTVDATLATANVTAAAAGAGTNIACSRQFPMASIISNKNRTAKTKHNLMHVVESAAFRSRRHASVEVIFSWTPPKELVKPALRQMSPIALLPKKAAYTIAIKHHKKKHVEYDIADGCELLANEGMDNVLKFIKSRYEDDPIGPRTRSALDAPPVSRIIAIFGVNKPTEIGAVYRRRCLLVKDDHKVEKMHTLDPSARLVSNKGGLTLKGGVLLETEKGAGKSGDGTVPFASMDHCRSWDNHGCKVTVVELQGADHREILADSNFHQTVLKHVVVSVEEKINRLHV